MVPFWHGLARSPYAQFWLWQEVPVLVFCLLRSTYGSPILPCFLHFAAKSVGLNNIAIHMNSKALVRVLQTTTTSDISIRHSLSTIRNLISAFGWCRIIKVHRDDLTMTFSLATKSIHVFSSLFSRYSFTLYFFLLSEKI